MQADKPHVMLTLLNNDDNHNFESYPWKCILIKEHMGYAQWTESNRTALESPGLGCHDCLCLPVTEIHLLLLEWSSKVSHLTNHYCLIGNWWPGQLLRSTLQFLSSMFPIINYFNMINYDKPNYKSEKSSCSEVHAKL